MSVLTLDKRNSYTIQILFKIKKKTLIDTSYLIIFCRVVKLKNYINQNLSCGCVPFINQRTLTPFPTGSASARAESEQWESWSVGVAPGFFGWFFVGILPQVFRYSLFLSTGFDRIFIRHLSTNSDKFRPRQKVQTFDTVLHRHLSTNFDIPHAKFRQISTSSVFR